MDIHGRDNSIQLKTAHMCVHNVIVQNKYQPEIFAKHKKIKKYIRILHSSLLVCAASPKVVQSVMSDGMTWFNQNNHCH